MRFDGKVALVTGGARGIGLAAARCLARDGARVAICDVLDELGQQSAAALKKQGFEAIHVPCDVSDRTQVEELINSVIATWGRLDAVCCSAAVEYTAPFLDFTLEDFEHTMRVNLTGVFLVGQAAAREMVRLGNGGAIVAITSVHAKVAVGESPAYAASKGAVTQLVKAMALALAPHGIRVNAVGPGAIDTVMSRSMKDDPAERARMLSRTPLKRMGSPEEIGDVVAFLCSNEASYITGQAIYADGGRLALNFTV